MHFSYQYDTCYTILLAMNSSVEPQQGLHTIWKQLTNRCLHQNEPGVVVVVAAAVVL
jgi:hypothetical protein